MVAKYVRLAMAMLVAAVVTGRSYAADPTPVQHFRVSALEGLPVRNAAGENLGKIKDMVIDLKSGTIRYVALDFGGFLGLGDKLFAVPWSALQYQDKPNDEHLVLNVSKERLKNAPGFDKSHWPDMADPHWNSDVDRYYAPASARR